MTRRWNLNERHGYYVATGLCDPVIDLHLGFKPLTGATQPVGRFRLDLDALVARGVVTRRTTPVGEVYDVKIVRDPDGSYWLAVRSSPRVALRSCAVR